MLSKTGSLYDAIHAHTTNPKQLMSLKLHLATQVSECPVSLSLSASQEENSYTLRSFKFCTSR